MPRVVGLDLSLTATGIAYPDGSTRTLDPAPRRAMDRIMWLRDRIGYEVQRSTVPADGTLGMAADPDWGWPGVVVIEDYAFSRGGHAHEAGELGGVIKAMLYENGLPYVLVGPTNLKRFALGKGGGKGTDKVAMGVAAMKRAGREFTTDDECDAWWLWAMGRAALGAPVVELPQAHLDALTKVAWPTNEGEAA